MRLKVDCKEIVMLRYKLPESTVVIDGKVDLIRDTRLSDDPRVYLDDPTTTILTGVRADSSHGERTLDPPRRGDSSFTVHLTDDERLMGLAFNSVGVGSKLVGAGVKVVAVVVGAAARVAGSLATLTPVPASAGTTDQDKGDQGANDASKPNNEPPSEEDARAAWEEDDNSDAVEHQKAYKAIVKDCTARLLTARQEMPKTQDPWEMANAARRVEYLAALLAEAKGEVAKVEGLYDAWSAARMKRYPQHVTFTFAIDELPVHPDPTSYVPALEPETLPNDGSSVLRHIWDTLSVFVEIGPDSPQSSYRPNTDGIVKGLPDERAVSWRKPRAARLWVWRRDTVADAADPGTASSSVVLEQITDVLVADRFSTGDSLKLEGRIWGEQAAELAFNDLGVPTTFITGDKSAVGAIADAIAAAPEQFASGLDSVSKASTALGELSSAGAELRLKTIKRQVEQRTQELELEGIDATAEDFAELKRLQQRVAIATAQGSLAPASDLDRIQSDLSRETAQRDLEAVRRDRANATELGAIRSEMDQLKAELELQKLRDETGHG